MYYSHSTHVKYFVTKTNDCGNHLSSYKINYRKNDTRRMHSVGFRNVQFIGQLDGNKRLERIYILLQRCY